MEVNREEIHKVCDPESHHEEIESEPVFNLKQFSSYKISKFLSYLFEQGFFSFALTPCIG